MSSSHVSVVGLFDVVYQCTIISGSGRFASWEPIQRLTLGVKVINERNPGWVGNQQFQQHTRKSPN
jgi:hypothetical protein